MEQSIATKQLTVEGMSCSGCELKIEKKLKASKGVHKVEASYNNGRVIVTFDKNLINLSEIKQTINALDYSVVTNGAKQSSANKSGSLNLSQLAYIAVIILGAFMIINRFGGFDVFNAFPQAKEGMSYAALFIIGLLTSVHCIAMCGGINLSQCATINTGISDNKLSNLRPSLLYNLGRVISYTVIGGIVGALGSVISLSGGAKGAVAIFAGIFMVIMGLNMLNVFPLLRKFSLRMPKLFTSGINNRATNNSPFFVGLLNGLMPCGPLQAMQLYALSTGDPLKGAVSMFLFSFGTVPLMFGIGAISTLLSKRFTSQMMSVSAVLVIILGVFMLNNGLSLSGIMVFGSSNALTISVDQKNSDDDGIEIVDGVQIVSIDITPRSYAPITVKKDIPVKWIINAEAKNINGCNDEIIVPKYNISKPLEPGENIIEFTPTETGAIPYSCWMGMIRSKITVIE